MNTCFNDQREAFQALKRFGIWQHGIVGEREMKQISKQANLSKTYKNNLIRATAVTILNKSGFEARYIMTVSGHKNESNVRRYCTTDLSKMQALLSTECTCSF